MTVGASVTAPVVGDAPRLRLIRLRVELCGSSAGFESARVPARGLAQLADPVNTDDFQDNTFGISDSGIIVGTYGLPANPCAAPGFGDVLSPRAFVWLPRPASEYGLPSVLPNQQVIDLQIAGGLTASGTLSVANDIPATNRYVLGGAGTDLALNSHGMVWDLAGATISGGVLSVPVTDIHGRIGYSGHAIGPFSVGHGIYQPTSSDPAMVVGTFLNGCEGGTARQRGFVLDFTSTALAYRLFPTDNAARSATYDISLDPSPGGSLLAVGWQHGFPPGPTTPCGFTLDNTDCVRSDWGSIMWTPPWDDDTEYGVPDDGERNDKGDGGGPSLESTVDPISGAFAGSLNRALNGDGERAGMGFKNHLGGAASPCPRRAAFWWWDSGVGAWNGWDLDTKYVADTGLDETTSRAETLSRRSASRDWLLVGGEDLRTTLMPFGEAVVWCGYASTWKRSELTPLVRFDTDGDLVDPLPNHYGLPSNWAVTFVHDMNQFGQMAVALTVERTAIVDSITTQYWVEYPCAVTLASDVNGDMRVDAADLVLVLSAYCTSCPTSSLFYDLDGDGIVTADYAIVLGDWSGTAPCDLHNSFPCNSTDSMAARGMDGSYDDALAAMGWTSVQEFAAWGAQAPIAQLTAIVEEIRAIVNSQNGGEE